MKTKSKNIIFYIFLLLSLLSFEIILYEDRLLPNLDTLHGFRSMKNFLIFDKPFSEFYSGMVYKWDEYDLFNYSSVYFDSKIFSLFKLNISLENFINYHNIIKLLIVIILMTVFRLIFNTYNYALLATLITILDASFSHLLHNSHHYFILFSLITFAFIYFKIPKNLYLRSYLIGFFFVTGCLTIVVTGIIWGINFIILVIFFYYKKIIDLAQFVLIIMGCLTPLSLYIFTNFTEILDFIDNRNFEISDLSYFYYTSKYSLLTLYNLAFGQHGNSILTLLIFLLYFNRGLLKSKIDQKLSKILLFSFCFFIILGSLINPLNYYSSRLGILTPILVYLIFKIYHQSYKNLNFFLNKQNYIIILIFLSLGIVKKFFDFEYNPNTLELIINTSIIGFLFVIIFKIYLDSLIKISKILLFILVGASISIKYFPDYKKNQISSFVSNDPTKKEYLYKNVHKIMGDYRGRCITTNYPIYDLFKNYNLKILSGVNLHSNKKLFWGDENCDLIILITNKNKKELNQFIKINFISNKKTKLEFNSKSNIFYRNSVFKLKNSFENENINIYAFEKIENYNKTKDMIYFSYK